MGALDVLESAFKSWVSLGKSLYHVGLSFPIEKIELSPFPARSCGWVCMESNRAPSMWSEMEGG